MSKSLFKVAAVLLVVLLLGTVVATAQADTTICFIFQDLETEFWVAGQQAITETLRGQGIEVLEYNASAERISGIPRAEAIGAHIWELFAREAPQNGDRARATGPDEPRLRDLARGRGDVLWYIAALCSELGLAMQDVAEQNLAKLRARQE